MEKILTIAVPSYNAAEYLKETIPTMAEVRYPEKLEIIIVNDGSTDNTLEEAEKLREKYPETVTILNKENGGHGSTINASIPLAKGKYYKVIDADDWIETDNLSDFMDYLENCEDDEVISAFYEVFMDSGTESLIDYPVKKEKFTYQYSELIKEVGRIPAMHSKTTKTSILQNNDITLDENCFYVDMEFITFTMPFVKTASYFKAPLYRYRLGTEGQSVNINSFIKNEKMHERVFFRMIDFYNTYEKELSNIEVEALAKLIKRINATHYKILLARPYRVNRKSDILRLENEVKSKNVRFYKENYGNRIKILRKSHYLAFWPLVILTHWKYRKF